MCGTVKAMLTYIVLHTYIRKEERTSIDTPSFHLDKQKKKSKWTQNKQTKEYSKN